MNRKEDDGNLILTNTQKQLIAQVTSSNFEPDLFGTLTFSSDPFCGKVNTFDKGSTQRQHAWVDDHIGKLLCRLNRHYFGSRWFKKMAKDKQSVLQSIFSIEMHSLYYHVHFIAQTPKTKGGNRHELRCNIQNYWQDLPYCYRARIQIEPIWCVDGAVSYISKDFEKNDSLGYSKHTNFS